MLPSLRGEVPWFNVLLGGVLRSFGPRGKYTHVASNKEPITLLGPFSLPETNSFHSFTFVSFSFGLPAHWTRFFLFLCDHHECHHVVGLVVKPLYSL